MPAVSIGEGIRNPYLKKNENDYSRYVCKLTCWRIRLILAASINFHGILVSAAYLFRTEGLTFKNLSVQLNRVYLPVSEIFRTEIRRFTALRYYVFY